MHPWCDREAARHDALSAALLRERYGPGLLAGDRRRREEKEGA